MPFNERQLAWIADFGSTDVDGFEARETQRSAQLSDVRVRLDAVKERLSTQYDYALEGKEKAGLLNELFGSRHETLRSKDQNRDALNEIDVVHDDLSGVAQIRDRDAFSVGLAEQELEALRDELLTATGPDGRPLFCAEDIMKEVYGPLVREGVMSENQVPDAYSEVANVFNQSARLYNERLEAFSATRSSKDVWKERLKLGSDAVSLAAGVAGPITEACGAAQATKVVRAVEIGLQAGVKVTETAIDRAFLDGLDATAGAVGDVLGLFLSKDVGKLVKKGIKAGTGGTKALRCLHDGDYAGALAAVGDAIAAGTACADPKGASGAKGIGEQIAFGFRQGKNAVKLGKAIQSGDPAAVAAVLADVAKESTGFGLGMTKHEGKDLTEEQEAENDRIDSINKMVDGSVDTTLAAGRLAKAAHEKDAEEMISAAGELGKGVATITTGSQEHADGESREAVDNIVEHSIDGAEQVALAGLRARRGDAAGTLAAGMKAAGSLKDGLIQGAVDREVEDLPDGLEDAVGMELFDEDALSDLRAKLSLKAPSAADLQAAREATEALEQAGNAAEIDEAARAFREMLAMSIGGADPDQDPEVQAALAEQYSIDALITQMEMDRAVLAAAEGIFDASADVAATIIPALAALKAGKSFIKNVVLAAKRAIELNTFLDSLDDANAACSAYADPIKKRISDTRYQLTNNVLEAILQCAIVVGATMSATPLAPAGVVVQKAAEAGKSAKDLARMFYEESELQSAWSLYQTALKNPLDRKVKRLAMQSNPTLSKYALAYGAYVASDPIAVDAIRKCGLTPETLANKSTNVDKVVQYLELTFSEDRELLRDVRTTPEWLRELTVAPTIEAWFTIKKKAVGSASLAMGPGEANIERCLVQLADRGDTDRDALAQLSVSLEVYRPRDASGRPHEGMVLVREQLVSQVRKSQELATRLAA